MTTKNTATPLNPFPATPDSAPAKVEETPFEAVASICSVLVVGLFILTFIAQNFVIPSGSMKKTLLVGDHLLVDRITLAPPAYWMPLVHYREPKRGDIIVFLKPVSDPDPVTGDPQYPHMVKRLIGVPGDHIHLRNGIVIINGVAQSEPYAEPTTPLNEDPWRDEFPSVTPVANPAAYIPEEWAVNFADYVQNGDLVVPPGKYFMMGDNRHNSADSRYWGFVPRANIVGRPLLNYWSFETPDNEIDKTGLGNKIAWIGHVAVHFFTDTRWKRAFKLIH